MSLCTSPYRDELIATAKAMVAPGKGVLAADESTGTIGKRLASIGQENTQVLRREYRNILFTTPKVGDHISGVITYEETLFDKVKNADGVEVDLVQALKDAGVIVGIKVDLGAKPMPNTLGETATQGLTDLDKRCKRYYEQGARFSKWRAVLKIDPATGLPSNAAVQESAWTLARYAALSQEHGLVPIVEPEILMTGTHDIDVSQRVTEQVLSAVFKALQDQHVLLEGMLLKPNMVHCGSECEAAAAKATSTPEVVAARTVATLQRCVPPAVPGIVFLSGGLSEDEATANLNAMNANDLGARPWALSFSYGRALQASCLQAWKGDTAANTEAAQAAFTARAVANGAAALGKL